MENFISISMEKTGYFKHRKYKKNCERIGN